MFGMRSLGSFGLMLVTVVAATFPLNPSTASAATRRDVKTPRVARAGKSQSCSKADVDIPAGRQLDPKLAQRVQLVAKHFCKDGRMPRVIFGASTDPADSNQHSSRAKGAAAPVKRAAASSRGVDFRIEGVKREALLSYCRGMQDMSCAYMPAEGLVRMDLRAASSSPEADQGASNQTPASHGSSASQATSSSDPSGDAKLGPLPSAANRSSDTAPTSVPEETKPSAAPPHAAPPTAKPQRANNPGDDPRFL